MEAKRNAEALRRKERERLLGNGPDGKRKGRNDKLSYGPSHSHSGVLAD